MNELLKCPHCGSKNVDWGDPEAEEGNTIVRRHTCNNCLCDFTEYFSFDHYEIDWAPEED